MSGAVANSLGHTQNHGISPGVEPNAHIGIDHVISILDVIDDKYTAIRKQVSGDGVSATRSSKLNLAALLGGYAVSPLLTGEVKRNGDGEGQGRSGHVHIAFDKVAYAENLSAGLRVALSAIQSVVPKDPNEDALAWSMLSKGSSLSPGQGMHSSLSNVSDPHSILSGRRILGGKDGMNNKVTRTRSTVVFSQLCSRVFQLIEVFFGCVLPLFVEDDPELDVSIVLESEYALELTLFLTVLSAFEQELSIAGINSPLVGGSGKAPMGFSGASSSTGTILNAYLKGTYTLRCEPYSKEEKTFKEDVDSSYNTRSVNKHWIIRLEKTVVLSKRAKISLNSNTPRSGRKSANSSSRKAPELSVSVPIGGSTTAALAAASSNHNNAPEANVALPGQVFYRLANIIARQCFDSRIDTVDHTEDKVSEVLTSVWSLKLSSSGHMPGEGVEEHVSSSAPYLCISPYLRHFDRASHEEMSYSLSHRNSASGQVISTEQVDSTSGLPLVSGIYPYKNSWLYVDSHIGDPLSLLTSRDMIKTLGVPIMSCPMYNLHKHRYRHPVVIVYEGLLGELGTGIYFLYLVLLDFVCLFYLYELLL